ncbi:MAG: hypothetical protein JW774_09870 [Candidatus Aureabacteria bacterium]|nr:hypothetical protein [Candidatus Auribacterota bacterium]
MKHILSCLLWVCFSWFAFTLSPKSVSIYEQMADLSEQVQGGAAVIASDEQMPSLIDMAANDIYTNLIPSVTADSSPREEILVPNRPQTTPGREVTLFFKANSLAFPEFYKLIMKTLLKDKKTVLTGMKIMNAAHLKQKGMMERHYGVINNVAQNARWMGDEKLKGIADHFNVPSDHVVGGLEAVTRINEILRRKSKPEISITDIEIARMWSKAGKPFKTMPGIYSKPYTFEGETFAVVDGFYAAQLNTFYTQGCGILAFSVRLSPDFEVKALRDLIGANDPTQAKEGTFRNVFLGMNSAANVLENGIHGSAGYLEGLRELMNIMGFDLKDTGLFAALREKGHSEQELEEILKILLENPEMFHSRKQKMERVFDCTEELPLDEVVKWIDDLIVTSTLFKESRYGSGMSWQEVIHNVLSHIPFDTAGSIRQAVARFVEGSA